MAEGNFTEAEELLKDVIQNFISYHEGNDVTEILVDPYILIATV